jgi:hypothetical protein
MAYALVDNATLTGVQRLLGEIPLRSTDVVEADIGALENLVQAVLLYDEIVAVDDYKERFRDSRKKRFPFIRFLDPNEFGLPEVHATAIEQIKDLNPTISGGEFSDPDLRILLEQLRMQMVCTWDMASSVYYLTMKLLGQPRSSELTKYSALSAAIFGELQDLSAAGGNFDPSVTLLDSRGDPITEEYKVVDRRGKEAATGGATRSLQTFVAALRWLTFRTVYYALAAEHLRADCLLFPVRQHYHLYYLRKTRRLSGDFVSATIDAMNQRVAETIDSVVSANRPSRLTLELPLFSAWIVSRTQDVREVLPAALEMRDEPDFRNARDQLREIRILVEEGDAAAASRRTQGLLRELDSVLQTLRRRFGLKTVQGPAVSTAVQVINPILAAKTGIMIPEVGTSVNMIPTWLAERWPRRGAGALYRDVSRDLTQFPRLGKVRDLLGDAVDSETENATSFPLKTEAPRFRHAKSDWKIPM